MNFFDLFGGSKPTGENSPPRDVRYDASPSIEQTHGQANYHEFPTSNQSHGNSQYHPSSSQRQFRSSGDNSGLETPNQPGMLTSQRHALRSTPSARAVEEYPSRKRTPQRPEFGSAESSDGRNGAPMSAQPGSSSRRYQKTAQRIRAPLFRKIENAASRNIVIFGETGTGKSSLINMLSDNEVATVSNLAVGGTFESTPYPITIDGEHYTLWDTAGLNEGDAGSVPADAALDHLRDLVEKLHDGLSLLVYCIRGSRYRDIIKVNYDLFTKIICQGEVPVVIVVTGLENEDRMDDWWIENEKEFTSRKMRFDGHACVTTTKGKKNMFEEEYEESRVALRALMKVQCPSDAWLVDSDAWFQRITTRIQEYYDDYNGYSAGALMDIDVKENSPSGSLSALGAFFSLLLALIRR